VTGTVTVFALFVVIILVVISVARIAFPFAFAATSSFAATLVCWKGPNTHGLISTVVSY
jgi:hypothetical protein